jgi:predicted dehydrogenase
MNDDQRRARPVDRREFMTVAGSAVAVSLIPATGQAAPTSARRRYALVGTGARGVGMWGRDLVERYADVVDFVGLCDVNPLRVEVGKRMIGASCPTFTDLRTMLAAVRPDALIVTTVDATHADCIVQALEAGVDVITEKPMVTDEAQCRRVLEAEKRTGRRLVVTFNARYAPVHQKIKELLLAGEIGRITSVDFSEYLDTRHGADYFRRWHRLRGKSGSLWVHKATHHFDLINWWLGAEPEAVSAAQSLSHYGRAGPFRHTHCRPCPHKARCDFYWDITKSPHMMDLYVGPEKADGYLRDGCVFKEDIDIPDTMNAVVRYSNGVTMSYSLNTYVPMEGYRVAFNGTRGRLDVRSFDRHPWAKGEETEIHLLRSFAPSVKVDLPAVEGAHGGGDDRLRDLIFRNTPVPDYMRLPGSRAGAMSCLTGIAALKSGDEGKPVRISELLNGL